MALPSSSKLIFLAFFLLNCLLWSSSRYGHIPETSSQSSLVKRFASEWNQLSTEPGEGVCRPVAYPIDQQCSHVNENCAKSDTFLSIQYLQNYFCTELPLRPASFVGLIVWLIFLFSTLGISASDFFTPNLATIAQLLGLDENVAGVTFLAFGNGSPDVFSTFSAMRANSGSLAIGELLGAASFIVSCVVGSICIIKPFKVNPRPFLRDVGFFSVAVSMLLVILWDGHIRPWEAAAMVLLYLIYVVYVVVGTWWDRRRERLRMNEALARAEYQDDELPPAFDIPYRDDPSPDTLAPPPPSPPRARAISNPDPPRIYTDIPRRTYSRSPSPTPHASPQFSHMPSFSLVGALEFRQVVASLRQDASSSSLHMFDSPITPYAGGHYHPSRSRPRTPRERERNPFDESLGVPMTRSPQIRVSPALPDEADSPEVERNSRYLDDEAPIAMSSSIPTIHTTPASPTGSETDSESHTYLNQERSTRWQVVRAVYHTLFPSLHSFKNQSILGQIAAVFAAPAVLMLTLTLPVVVTPYECAHPPREKALSSDGTTSHSLVDFEEEGVERVLIAEEEAHDEMHGVVFNKWLTTAQCLFGPLFCVAVLFSGNSKQPWLFLAAGVAGFSAAVLVAVFAKRGDNPAFTMARCSMGFLVAVVWIMAIADEVVRVLQTFGFIFGLSDAIIGLTIFAVGNSLADLVANMSIAVFAPIMGFSACFGGPMLNILLGVGISGSYIISKTSQPYHLEFGRTLMVSTVGLLALLAATLIYVPMNGYHLTRRWGMFLIASYVAIMTTNVVVELKS
ncbi:sodium calcium exchanger protein [Moniliophthora roreri MCA 2997]|uniref:Sodium calcium exchanger protein n=2 Tax=Moniliophthora roreri TaxID=221103 RepID=V2YAS3_MONRO|nr:sodium calcium exchanger protein [Moniliophthora roreri MCA 2997]KAI3604816.1 sodium calcium exchanger protein [Moniliophthora roreri]